ncbi:hypothetical protein SDC9_109132 [bioreactor metagenome]|uniref:Phosphoserine phosphatase RsbU n=1 Tax=bioreactor metagenome TaxID=1076179 RepID=A0A645BB10_9ZZZZ
MFVPSADENNAVYVFDIYKDGDDPDLVASLGDESGPIDVYDLVYRIYSTGQTDGSTVVTSGEFGYLASAYTLVRASDGTPAAIVGADIEMNVIIREVWSHTLQILLMAVVIVLVSMAVALLVINRQIILPIRGLSLYMGRFASDKRNLNTERFTVRTGDEIELMADSFNRMAEDVKSYTEHLAAVTADRERIATELQVATQIQASMLPSIFPPFPDRKEFDIYARMEPAKEVGGDFYDFFMIDDRRLGVVIADVSGKGVPAALFMVITKTLIKNQAGFSQTPAEILRLVNNKLLETNDAGFFVTVFMGILEVDNGRFTYSNAGHNLPLLSRAGGQYEFLQADSGFVLAGWEDFDYQTEAVTLNEGDRLVFYTDGVTEALNPREELFGDDRLLETVNRPEAARMPLEALVQLVRDEVERFADGAQQADDITLMALSFGNRQQ